MGRWLYRCGWGLMLLWLLLGLHEAVETVPAASTIPYEQRLAQALGHMQHEAWQQALEAIGDLPHRGHLTPVQGRLWFLRGVLAQKLQDPETARQAFERVWQGYPPLADYAAWEMVQYEAARDRLPSLQKLVSALIERYPFSYLVPESHLLLARTQHRLGHCAPARTTLERLLHEVADYPVDHPVRPEAMAFLGQVYEDCGELALAAQTLRHLGESYPRDRRAAAALRRSRELVAGLPEPPPQPDPEQLLASIDRLAEGQLWQEIDARLTALARVSPAEALALAVLLKRAGVEVRRGRLPEARAALQDILRQYPQGSHLAEVYYLLGVVAQRQQQPGESLRAYETALAQPPAAPWTPKVLWALARLYEERQALNKASALYLRLAQAFPTHAQADESLWQAGWLHYYQKDYQAALAIWESFEQRFPRSLFLPRVLYWQARAAAQVGYTELALRLYQRLLEDYPAHYYSAQASVQAASVRSPLLPQTAPYTTPVLLHDPTLLPEATQGQASRAHFHLTRVRELHQLQMYTPAGHEIRTLAALLPKTPAAQYMLASLYVDNQQRPTAFRVLQRLLESLSPAEVRGLPRDFWMTLYPQAFWPEIRQHAQAKGLNPYLVLSIIRQESAFNPTAISSSGARGLMQLLPTTAQEVLTRLKLPPDAMSRLHDPQLSIILGIDYFAGLMQRYQHNVVLALAGYNAGPGRASRWREQWAGLPADEFIERIPLDETRNYVKLILRNLMMYERLYKAL